MTNTKNVKSAQEESTDPHKYQGVHHVSNYFLRHLHPERTSAPPSNGSERSFVLPPLASHMQKSLNTNVIQEHRLRHIRCAQNDRLHRHKYPVFNDLHIYHPPLEEGGKNNSETSQTDNMPLNLTTHNREVNKSPSIIVTAPYSENEPAEQLGRSSPTELNNVRKVEKNSDAEQKRRPRQEDVGNKKTDYINDVNRAEESGTSSILDHSEQRPFGIGFQNLKLLHNDSDISDNSASGYHTPVNVKKKIISKRSSYSNMSDESSEDDEDEAQSHSRIQWMQDNIGQNFFVLHDLEARLTNAFNFSENVLTGECHLPQLSWADSYEIWRSMFIEDINEARFRSSTMFDAHPVIEARMRAIVLDWLNETAENLTLNRETYYLSIEYFDRFLNSTTGIKKDCLQCIGITCLYIASKLEQSCRFSVSVFADLTEGNCSSIDIRRWEGIILQTLRWKVNPKTPIHWMRLYLQISNTFNNTTFYESQRREIENTSTMMGLGDIFLFPMFAKNLFEKAAQLLDLCVLDAAFNNYPYSISAAAALGLIANRNLAEYSSGLNWSAVEPCAEWMKLFYREILENPDVSYTEDTFSSPLNHFEDTPSEEQIYITSMELYDNVHKHFKRNNQATKEQVQ